MTEERVGWAERFGRACAWLGLIDPSDADLARWQRRQCARGRHEWGLWSHDTSPVPIMIDVGLPTAHQLGWGFVPISGPDYRRCLHCPAMERRP